MNEEEKKFNEITSELGGIYINSEDSFLQLTRIRLKKIISGYKLLNFDYKPCPKIIIDIVNDMSCNAFAGRVNDTYIIGINIGLIKELESIFTAIMNNEKLFSNIKEEEKRDNYFLHLFFLVTDFIAEHELSHILNGHVDWIANKFGLNRITEINLSPKITHENFDFQTLEMDADCTALTRLCGWSKNMIDRSIPLPIVKDFFVDYYSILTDTFLSISAMIKIFGDGDYSETRIGKSTHPNPRLRQLYILYTLFSINIHFNMKLDSKILSRKLYKAFEEMENVSKFTNDESINPEVFKPEYYQNNPLITAVKNNWKTKMKEELKKYSFIKLAE